MGPRHRLGTQTKLNEILNNENLWYVVLSYQVPVFKSRVHVELYQPEKKREFKPFFPMA